MQPDLDHFLVSASEREVQKAEGIEDRLRCMPECFEQHLLRYFRRASTVGMAAHAIHHHQQACMLRDGRRHSILIVFSMAEETDIGVFDLQEGPCVHLLDFAALYITLTCAA
jgi:hypothetical protein